MSQGNNNQKNRPLDVIRTVKTTAINHWQSLLPACGVDVPAKGKHGACPICGGTDRFHFIDDNHHGDWHCRQCDKPNHGDGLDLVARTKGLTVFAAAKLVADVLALPLPEPKPVKEQPRTVKPITERIAALVATSVMGESQYLMKKGLQCPNQRLLKDGSLLLEVQTLDGTITGGQTIKPNGEKRLVSGTQKKGSFIPVSEITGTPDTFIITEGYATALTVSQLHEGVVLAAIDESNLLTVAEQVRAQWPDAKIILAADNDWHEPEERDKNCRLKKNVGKIAAEKTAKAINGWVTLPPTALKSDWDDYRQHHGI
ncbi:toprim domain-containing protein, partial [Xenorhabdus sp. PB30.3]|uniref:toprim domain-containing protein n=1 Tax=Xenorhabdus sp. PB30.3 TaxID=2788941 RepID=UPI001E313470